MPLSQKHTDLTYLTKLSNGDKAFIREMLALFIEQVPDMMARMTKYLELKDWNSLSHVAHKMKPSVMFVGLKEIEADVKKVEDYAADRVNTEDIPGMVDKIKRVCAEAIDELKEEKGHLM